MRPPCLLGHLKDRGFSAVPGGPLGSLPGLGAAWHTIGPAPGAGPRFPPVSPPCRRALVSTPVLPIRAAPAQVLGLSFCQKPGTPPARPSAWAEARACQSAPAFPDCSPGRDRELPDLFPPTLFNLRTPGNQRGGDEWQCLYCWWCSEVRIWWEPEAQG